MKRQLLIGVLTLLAVGCSQSPQQKIARLYKTGMGYANQFQFEKALSSFKRIGEIDASSPLGYYGTGVVYERQFRVYEALHVYLSIVSSAPSFAPAYRGAWRVFSHLEEYDDAAQAAAEYARLLDSDPEAHLVFAEALIHIGQSSRARRQIDSALSLGADPRIVSLLKGQSYADESTFDSAEAVVQTVISDIHDDPTQLARAAVYLESFGLVDSCVSLSRSAMEKAEKEFDFAVRHFLCALRHSYFFEARRTIDLLKSHEVPEVVTTGMELLYSMARGDQTQSRHADDGFSRLTAMSIDALVYDIMVWGKADELMTAMKNGGAIIQLMSRDEYDEDFQKFMRYRLGLLIGTYFDDQSALEWLQSIPARYSNRREIGIRTAYCFYRTGQIAEFEEAMDQLHRFRGAQPQWLTRMADIYADRFVRQYNKADDHYRAALKLDPWHRPAFANAVAMYRRLGKPKDALALFEDYPYFVGQYPELALQKALCEVEDGQVPSGTTLFDETFPKVRGDLLRFQEMAKLLDRLDRPDEKQRLFEALIVVNSDNADALVMGSKHAGDRGDYDQALSLAEQALNMEPGFVDASAHRAYALYGLGRRSEALGIFEDNAATAQFNVANNYRFSRILASEQIDLDRAANLARRAVHDSGHDLEVWMNLCYVYYRSGRFDLSRGEALKASHKYTSEPEPYFRIGMAMYMEGNEQSRQNLKKAIELGLRGDELEEAESTLQKL